MKQWRFEVFSKPGFGDVHGNNILQDIKELGIRTVEAVSTARVFLVEADIDRSFADRMAKELLADPVCEDVYIGRRSLSGSDDTQKRCHRPSGRIGGRCHCRHGCQGRTRAYGTSISPKGTDQCGDGGYHYKTATRQ